jgi:hypothetical protein
MKYSTITYGLVWLVSWLGMAGCELVDPREGLETNEVIQLSVSQAEVLADGRSRVVLTATLGPAVNGNRAVTFGTDQGMFDGSGTAGSDLIQVNSSGREARATLLTNTQPNERVTLTASVEANGQAFTDFAEVAFVPALPELISLRVTALQVSTTNETTLEVSLFRNEGAVSEGRRIDLSTTPVGGSAALAVVPDFIFSENGVASAVIQSRNDSTGMVRLTARTPAADGGELSQSIDITFVD